jgi:DNA modification methylase
MNKIKLKDFLKLLAGFKVCVKAYNEDKDKYTIIINNVYELEALEALSETKFLNCEVLLITKEYFKKSNNTYLNIIIYDKPERGEE